MRVHFIEDQGTIIAFFPDSLRFFGINEFTQKIIEAVMSEMPKAEVVETCQITSEQYDQFAQQLQTVAQPVPNVDEDFHQRNVLERLVLNISNDCNLRCGYCSANGGTYGSEASLMSVEVAVRTMELALQHYENIQLIQLFGGEPCLNLPAIQAVAEYLDEHFATSSLKSKPVVGIVTNGTIVNNQFIDLIRRYDLQLTVSLDGPESVHNAMRPFRNGRGSYQTVFHNIQHLREATGQPRTIEMTYHSGHTQENFSVADMVRFVDEHFPGTDLHIVPVDCAVNNPLYLDSFTTFVDAVDTLFQYNHPTERPFTMLTLKGYINNVSNKTSCKMLCAAAVNTLAINTKGDVYACFQYVDRPEYRMGHVFDEDLFEQPAFRKVREFFLQFDKLSNEPCKSCFINRICRSCFWRNEFFTQDPFTFTTDHCEMNRKMVERVIVNMAKSPVTTSQPTA